MLATMWYSNPKSFVNFLLPPRGFGEGWGGVKMLRLLQGLLYLLFNVIVGAKSIHSDLFEAAQVYNFSLFQR